MKTFTQQDKLISLIDAKKHEWDVIILGGGMGGCACAYGLAKRGHKVLLVEKGLANFNRENYGNVVVEVPDPDERIENGRWPTKLMGVVDGKKMNLWAPLGCGVGGSTLLYAAALQRLKPIDFEPQTFPEGEVSWPFSYKDLEPYYQQCEAMFGVRGTADPLDREEQPPLLPPPAMCERDQKFYLKFKQAGLHPYRLHVAMEYKNPCGECGGQICASGCKKDGHNGFVVPALATGNLFIIEQTEVIKIHADNTSVYSVELTQGDTCLELSAKKYVLAAGGYMTPAVLLKSASEHWPDGLANSSGLVGKNLMFHVSDFIAFWPEHKHLSTAGANKTIAIRDYYETAGVKLGEIQSTGLSAGYGNILYGLRLLYDQSVFRKIPFMRHFLRIPAYVATKLLGEASIFTTIVEDFPHKHNKIVLDEDCPSEIRFEYRKSPELKARAKRLKNAIRKRVKSLRSMPMNMSTTLNYGHPCGTCKAGIDPESSVVDENCKTHDLSNLYIADSTFMPTSGGTNPSLTVAANGLRVASKISENIE